MTTTNTRPEPFPVELNNLLEELSTTKAEQDPEFSFTNKVLGNVAVFICLQSFMAPSLPSWLKCICWKGIYDLQSLKYLLPGSL